MSMYESASVSFSGGFDPAGLQLRRLTRELALLKFDMKEVLEDIRRLETEDSRLESHVEDLSGEIRYLQRMADRDNY